MGKGEHQQKDLQARANIAAAFAAVFSALAAASFGQIAAVGGAGHSIGVGAGRVSRGAAPHRRCAQRGRAARRAQQERERAQLRRRAPVAAVGQVDPTEIGVDAAAQDILPGEEVPEYVARDVDDDLRTAVSAAFDGSGRWMIVVMGLSKIGKSRTLFEAVTHCGQGRRVEFVAPADGDALRTLVASAAEETASTPTVLWLDDLEDYLNDGVTFATLREWQAGIRGRIVAATYGGKGSERIAGSIGGALTTIAAEVMQSARQIPMSSTTSRELAALHPQVSAEQFASLERHGLAAYLVAAPALETKLATHRHAPGEPACPDGAAVVAAAVDWARCGRTDPIATNCCASSGQATSRQVLRLQTMTSQVPGCGVLA